MVSIIIKNISQSLPIHNHKRYHKRDLSAVRQIVIHHSATSSGTSLAFANFHINHHDWPGIGYHYVILKNGIVQETQKLTTVSYHVSSHNLKSIGICLVGDFTTHSPPLKQYAAAVELVRYLQKDKPELAVFGHSECPGNSSTRCPALNMHDFRGAVRQKAGSFAAKRPMLQEGMRGEAVVSLQSLLRKAGFSPGQTDGIFGPKTSKAVRAYQYARKLAVDGIVGPLTWGELQKP
ncbi:N-acetylmuramoyl-L-alanine amidase [Alteribacillus sp. HJP-4]|uniref:peptidoglycan recognition protein family protein n=1 Tax=Alteribacillus sp. HJP-4 TaxID=2775394 RepID=UPI0035CD29DD